MKYVIQESVRKILKENNINELDWRTYRSAAEKSRQQANNPNLSYGEKKFHQTRANAFDNAEDESFIQKHKISKYDADNKNDLSTQRANAEYGRHVRGGDEYRNGAWRKINESQLDSIIKQAIREKIK